MCLLERRAESLEVSSKFILLMIMKLTSFCLAILGNPLFLVKARCVASCKPLRV